MSFRFIFIPIHLLIVLTICFAYSLKTHYRRCQYRPEAPLLQFLTLRVKTIIRFPTSSFIIINGKKEYYISNTLYTIISKNNSISKPFAFLNNTNFYIRLSLCLPYVVIVPINLDNNSPFLS